MIENILSKRLAEARNECGYTQNEVADYLGCGRATITNYESGRRNPDIETLVKLAEYYEVSVDYLLGISSIETSNQDIKFINEYTGLSVKAIANLTEMKGLSENPEVSVDYIKTINFLIESAELKGGKKKRSGTGYIGDNIFNPLYYYFSAICPKSEKYNEYFEELENKLEDIADVIAESTFSWSWKEPEVLLSYVYLDDIILYLKNIRSKLPRDFWKKHYDK